MILIRMILVERVCPGLRALEGRAEPECLHHSWDSIGLGLAGECKDSRLGILRVEARSQLCFLGQQGP